MKNYTVVPNRISSLFSPNDLYTLQPTQTIQLTQPISK